MKFYGNGIVWDKENDKPLMKFPIARDITKLGVYETNDKRICSELIRLGYKSDSVVVRKTPPEPPKMPEIKTGGVVDNSKIYVESESGNENVAPDVETPKVSVESVSSDMKVTELREIAKKYDITFKFGITKVDMAKAINEAMK